MEPYQLVVPSESCVSQPNLTLASYHHSCTKQDDASRVYRSLRYNCSEKKSSETQPKSNLLHTHAVEARKPQHDQPPTPQTQERGKTSTNHPTSMFKLVGANCSYLRGSKQRGMRSRILQYMWYNAFCDQPPRHAKFTLIHKDQPRHHKTLKFSYWNFQSLTPYPPHQSQVLPPRRHCPRGGLCSRHLA